MHHRRLLKAAGQDRKADEEPSPVLAAPPTGSVAPVPVAGLVARHTAAEHHGSDGSTMDSGERRAGGLSIHALRPRSDRTTTPARAIRRVSLFVPHKDGAKSVFINDYHFIYRLGAAKMSSSAEVGGHAVVLSDFTDFNGLAQAASADLEKSASVRKSAHDRFEFADITWGWNGARELFPVPDGKHCCDFGGKQIAIMMQIAHSSTLDEAPGDLKEDVNFQRALALLRSKQRPEGAATAEGSTDPFQFDYSAMPTSLRWKVGKEPKQSFVYPRFEADGETPTTFTSFMSQRMVPY